MEMWAIVEIDEENDSLVVDFDGHYVEYTRPFFSNLTLAYAMSVHKAQGSEFNIVFMCVFKEYGWMLNKKLIYTAVSRAKKSLIILGDEDAFMIKSNEKRMNHVKYSFFRSSTKLRFKIYRYLSKYF